MLGSRQDALETEGGELLGNHSPGRLRSRERAPSSPRAQLDLALPSTLDDAVRNELRSFPTTDVVRRFTAAQTGMNVMIFQEGGSLTHAVLTRAQIIDEVNMAARSAAITFYARHREAADASAAAASALTKKATAAAAKAGGGGGGGGPEPALFFGDVSAEHRSRRATALADEAAAHHPLMREFVKLPAGVRVELMRGTLSAREARRIDGTFLAARDPTIAVRRHAVLINLYGLRTIVTHDRCFLIVPAGADEILEVILERLRDRRERTIDGETFELRAIEAIFLTIVNMLEADAAKLASNIREKVKQVKSSPSSLALDYLKSVKTAANVFDNRVQGAHDAVLNVLQSDEDMSKMGLTELQIYPERWNQPGSFENHEAVELMLEHYLEVIDGTRRTNLLLLQDIENTEALIEIQLDANRNRLMKVELLIQSVSMAMLMASMVAGVFGMNLRSHYETDPDMFGRVCWTLVGFACLITGGLMAYYRQLDLL